MSRVRNVSHGTVAVWSNASVRPKTRCCQGVSKTTSPFERGGAAGPATSTRSKRVHEPGRIMSATPIIASRVTSPASSASLRLLGPRRTHRKDQEPCLGGAVPDPNPDPCGHVEAHFSQQCARLGDHTGPVLRALVPAWRQPQYGPRIARAQCADDDVVYRGRVLDDFEAGRLRPAKPELGDRFCPVGEQAPPVHRIDPRASDDLRAVHRANVVGEVIDEPIDCIRVDHATAR